MDEKEIVRRATRMGYSLNIVYLKVLPQENKLIFHSKFGDVFADVHVPDGAPTGAFGGRTALKWARNFKTKKGTPVWEGRLLTPLKNIEEIPPLTIPNEKICKMSKPEAHFLAKGSHSYRADIFSFVHWMVDPKKVFIYNGVYNTGVLEMFDSLTNRTINFSTTPATVEVLYEASKMEDIEIRIDDKYVYFMVDHLTVRIPYIKINGNLNPYKWLQGAHFNVKYDKSFAKGGFFIVSDGAMAFRHSTYIMPIGKVDLPDGEYIIPGFARRRLPQRNINLSDVDLICNSKFGSIGLSDKIRVIWRWIKNV